MATILLHFASVNVVAFSPLSSPLSSSLNSMIAIKRASSAWTPRVLASTRASIRSQVVAVPRLWMSTDTNQPAEKTEEEKAAIKAAREARK